MKYLYHVTGAEYLPAILREGIRPRQGREAGQPVYASCPTLVYFTRPHRYPSSRCGAVTRCECALLVIDESALVPELFRPDEDRLFDAGQYSCICGAVHPERQGYMDWTNHDEGCLITNIEAHAKDFTDDDITVAYKGTVSPDAIVASGPLWPLLNAPKEVLFDPCSVLAFLGQYNNPKEK